MPSSGPIPLIIVASAVTIGVVVTATMAEVRPVLISVSPDPTMLRPRNYCVMNPFRDRAPERAADRFLAQLRDGRREVLNVVDDPSARAHFIDREMQYPIKDWRIGRRENDEKEVFLMYWAKRGNGYAEPGYEEEVYITVERDSARVIGFSAVY